MNKLPGACHFCTVWKGVLLLFLTAIMGGCAAPDDLGEGIQWYAAGARESDASTRAVDERPFLRFDDFLLHRLDELNQAPLPTQAGITLTSHQRAEFLAILDRAQTLGDRIAHFEIDRMTPARRAEMARRYGILPKSQSLPPDPAGLRQEIIRHFDAESARWLAREEAHLQTATGRAFRDYMQDLRDRIKDGIKEEGHFFTVLIHLPLMPVAVIETSTLEDHEYWGKKPIQKDFRRIRVLRPAASPASDTESREMALLERFAPVIVQQLPDSKPSYDPKDDRIGRVLLSRDLKGRVQVRVDTKAPAVYAYMEQAEIKGVVLPQLVYTMIFPERPALHSPDFEAGHLDTSVLRVTLDADGQAAIYESVYACGCHHRVRVAEHITREASPSEGHHPLELRQHGQLKGLHVVEDVPDPLSSSDRLTVYEYAGYHMMGGVRWTSGNPLPQATLAESGTYTLLPYEELEHQRTGNRYASLFDQDGLMIGADRPESLWLAGAGLFSAGHPRQRGTIQILLDKYDMDDPTLLDKTLALPEAMAVRSVDQSAVANRP